MCADVVDMKFQQFLMGLEKRVPEFTFADNDKKPVIKLGIAITLFFKGSATREKKHRIIECYRRFREEFGEFLCFQRHEFTNMKRYTPENIQKVEEAILSVAKGQYSGWDISDAKGQEYAPDYLINYLDSSWDDSNGYLSVTFPWHFMKSQEGIARIHDWLIYLCKQLEPDSGECGYCLALPRSYHEYEPMEYRLAQRYHSLQVNSTVHMQSKDYDDAIRSINWFTVLGTPFIKRLGGEEWVTKHLSRCKDIETERYANGLIIRLGPYPDLSLLADGIPEAYTFLNRFIRPIRVKPSKADSFHHYGQGQFNKQSTLEWYSRYDKEPLIVTPLQAGTPALVSGFWSTPSKAGMEVFMAQGTIAPDERGQAPGTTLWELTREAETITG